ncbi:MAG TPA: universal stress protein [Xanthobacteraceae bacterium]|jgi:nucleotide-binding universal stress UspA family protein|nr:universal stress protein [Xanthobacteraceae bacterium]
MSMKTILVPIELHDIISATLETALLLARRFDSAIEGFPLRPAVDNFVAMDPISGMAMATVKQRDAETAIQARALFNNFMQQHGVPRSEKPQPALSFNWLDNAPDGDNFVGTYGRVFDVIVLGRPGEDLQSPRMMTLEAGLFDSGRPVLIAPPSAPRQMGENILIAWNCSTEQARVTAFAMPLLRQAKRVTVLTVEGGTVPGPTGAQLVRSLQFNDIAAEAMTVGPEKRSTGEVILAKAAELGCDLLIKGAYTQSRLRQMIFGGTTRHILGHANLPVLMAH